MRFAKFSRTLLLLALPAVPVACAMAQDNPNIKPSAVRDQLMGQTPGVAQQPPSEPGKVQALPKGSKPAPAKGNPPAKPAAKMASQKPGAKPPVEKPAEEKAAGPRRDPFETLLSNTKPDNGPPANLPPGKAGLVVSTLRIDGIVHGAGGMIAIVSNPQQRVYFLREGDKLYDGSIEHITLEAITFHEFGKDAFGKPLEREVTKRLYPSPGEQQ
jgi:Tfp pilus assembly protein PilP